MLVSASGRVPTNWPLVALLLISCAGHVLVLASMSVSLPEAGERQWSRVSVVFGEAGQGQSGEGNEAAREESEAASPAVQEVSPEPPAAREDAPLVSEPVPPVAAVAQETIAEPIEAKSLEAESLSANAPDPASEPVTSKPATEVAGEEADGEFVQATGDASGLQDVDAQGLAELGGDGEAVSVGGGVPSEDARAQAYLSEVRARIERNKRYPEAARRMFAHGRVELEFTIMPDGELADLGVLASSGSNLLDKAALAAVRDAAPFPEPPGDVFSGSVDTALGLVFELR